MVLSNRTLGLGLMLALLTAGATTAAPLTLASPDGKVVITVDASAEAVPTYAVAYAGQPVIAASTVGLNLDRGRALGPGMVVSGSTRKSGEDAYALIGKASSVRDRYNELVVDFSEPAGRKMQLVFRAYDDGAAFRYRIPRQAGMDGVSVRSEATKFAFPRDYDCWGLNLGGYRTAHEGEYDPVRTSMIRPTHLYETPLVCKAGSAAFAIAEADLRDWAGMYLTRPDDGTLSVQTRLSPRLDDPSVAVRTRIGADVQSPWRVVMLGASPVSLITSTLIPSLNPPPAFDASWVKPGLTAWDWWNGPTLSSVKKAGMNNETIKAFMDFASSKSIPYMLLDEGWYYGSTAVPAAPPGSDVTRSIPEIDLSELVAYGKSKNVDLWIWVRWDALDRQMEEALALYSKLGVKGIKVDFMDRDDQEMVGYYHRLLSRAAHHKLMVDLHGAYRPTGLIRTYPNYLTQEGVMGAEYNKWSHRVTARHNVTLPFTRNIIGPMDYTQGGFRNVAPEAFVPSFATPTVKTTRAHGLAMYVVYESPFGGVSDSPDVYAKSPAGLDFITAAPTTWDETRAISGEIGDYVVLARRKGDDWWLGAMTNEAGRTVKASLSFLGEGRYTATIHADGAAPDAITTTMRTVTAKDTLSLVLAPTGGAAVRLTPLR